MGTSRARQGAAQTEGDFSGSFSRTAGVRGASGAGAEKNGKLCFPLDTTQYRVSGRIRWRAGILLPGKGRSIRALILPVQREQKCLLRKAVRWCRHTAAQAMAPVCVFSIQMAVSHFTPICSTPMSARARWWKQGSCWAQQGAAGALREHTCILNCTGREQPVTRRMRWAFPHEAA